MSTFPKYLWLLCFLWIIQHSNADFKNVLLTYADSLLAVKAYNAAELEYKRFLFFHDGAEGTSHALEKLSDCQWNMQKKEYAIANLFGAIHTSKTDSIMAKQRIKLAAWLVQNAKFPKARQVLKPVIEVDSLNDIRHEAIMIEGISFILEGLWESGIDAISTVTKDKFKDSLTLFFNKNPPPKFVSPEYSVYLSSILPGAAQIYSGYIFNGAGALLINFATGYPLITSLLNLQVANSILYAWLFQRFYLGNRYNAKFLAIKKNKKLIQMYQKKLLTRIETLHN